MRRLLLLIAITLSLPCSAASRTLAGDAVSLVIANLALPPLIWIERSDEMMTVLESQRPDVIIVQDVEASGMVPPYPCELARRLHMRCEFITADPPSHPRRRGSVLMSSHPIDEDGISLLHSLDDSPSVAAGYLRLALSGLSIHVYTASLTSGAAHRANREKQTKDLRRWMATHPPAPVTVIGARFGADHMELHRLMPGFTTARRGRSEQSSHGLDVMYLGDGIRLHQTTPIQLPAATASTEAEDGLTVLAPGTPLRLGLVVELSVPRSLVSDPADTVTLPSTQEGRN